MLQASPGCCPRRGAARQHRNDSPGLIQLLYQRACGSDDTSTASRGCETGARACVKQLSGLGPGANKHVRGVQNPPASAMAPAGGAGGAEGEPISAPRWGTGNGEGPPALRDRRAWGQGGAAFTAGCRWRQPGSKAVGEGAKDKTGPAPLRPAAFLAGSPELVEAARQQANVGSVGSHSRAGLCPSRGTLRALSTHCGPERPSHPLPRLPEVSSREQGTAGVLKGRKPGKVFLFQGLSSGPALYQHQATVKGGSSKCCPRRVSFNSKLEQGGW